VNDTRWSWITATVATGARSAVVSVCVTSIAVSQATAPLQKYFGVRSSKKLRKFEQAAALPEPLYVLFAQLEALEDGHGECSCWLACACIAVVIVMHEMSCITYCSTHKYSGHHLCMPQKRSWSCRFAAILASFRRLRLRLAQPRAKEVMCGRGNLLHPSWRLSWQTACTCLSA
jgi:hypothetical protein